MGSSSEPRRTKTSTAKALSARHRWERPTPARRSPRGRSALAINLTIYKQEVDMPTYISLLRFTQKGVETIKDGPKRLDAAKERFRKAGAELKAFYLVTGQYDAVAISEAPDDATVAKLALGNASMGFVRTETLRAFTEDEYRKIAGSLG